MSTDKTIVISLTLPFGLVVAIDQIAKADSRSRSAMVRLALSEFLRHRDAPHERDAGWTPTPGRPPSADCEVGSQPAMAAHAPGGGGALGFAAAGDFLNHKELKDAAISS